jgi:uncharacterized protein YukE
MKTKTQSRMEWLKERADKAGRHWRDQWKTESYKRDKKRNTATSSTAIAGIYRGALNTDSFEACFLDYVGPADKLANLKHTGWYCDDMQWQTVRGHVVRYRRKCPATGKKSLVYVPAVAWSDADGVTIWPRDCYDEKRDAALSADGYAESIAEGEREYQEADTALQQAQDALEQCAADVRDARQQFAAIARDFRESVLSGAVCDLVRAELQDLRRTVRKGVAALPGLRETLDDAQATMAKIDAAIAANYPARV